MLILTAWQTPATEYPDCTLGRATIETTRYRGIYRCYGIRGYRHFQTPGIKVKRLLIDNRGWMIDDPPHWWAMEEHATFYHGHVLVAGLGLGLIVHTLSANARVRKITVVEREKDVIDLVAPHVPQCEIVHGDFWDYAGPTPDGVFFDLFVGDGRKLLPDAFAAYSQMFRGFPAPPFASTGTTTECLSRSAERSGRPPMRFGDLVMTDDGYYGIVVAEHEVFLGNGCQEIMDEEAWSKLQPLWLNVYQQSGAVSNFDALIEGRAPCQEQSRGLRNYWDTPLERLNENPAAEAKLVAAGYTTFRSVAEEPIGSLCKVKGVGNVSATRIQNAIVRGQRFLDGESDEGLTRQFPEDGPRDNCWKESDDAN